MTLRARARRAATSLGTLVTLPAGDRSAFASAWWALLSCRLRLRFPRALAARPLLADELRREAQTPRRAGSLPRGRLVSLFNRAVRHQILAVPCLPRALALKRFLRRYGVDSRLRIGMKKEEQGLVGHAWLECEGRVLNDRDELIQTFVPFRNPA